MDDHMEVIKLRKVIQPQKKLGQTDIAKIEVDLKCRDEIPRVVLGLQHIYCNQEIREKVFKILEELIRPDVDPNNGCPGMDLWKILVLGCIRLTCNWDYDKLHDIANNHQTIREMLGHGVMDEKYEYKLQTLKDNISLFTPEILERINQVVIKCGHDLIKGKKEELELELKGRCDSFVVETDVHYPTDINLLFDAIRKVIFLIWQLFGELGILGWRNSADNIKKVKKLFHKVRKLKRSASKDVFKQTQKEEKIKQAHQAYIGLCEFFLDRAEESLVELKMGGNVFVAKILEIESYMKHAYRQIDQIRRRVIDGETIAHHEKVFSIFEEHTEWISKGKAGVPQELGLRVCILEDQYGFLLHHRVMEKETDDQVAVLIVQETKLKYPNLKGCSFDKGFHSPENQKKLRELLDTVILPKKGKLSKSDKIVEYSEDFVAGRRQHSAVESAINGLENHGLDRCLDHGIYGLERYVSFAVLARNIEKLGTLIRTRKLRSLHRKDKRKLERNKAPTLKAA
jgi:hypothetical protein